MNICIDTDSIVTDSSRASSSTSTSDTLEKYGQWLLMIPRDDVSMLQNTQAYSTFLQAFDDLKRAHQQLATRELLKNSVAENDDHHRFLQHFAAEDIILRIFEYLEVCALVRIMMTCHRFHSLGEKSAEQRSQDFANPRMLSSKIKVLRAQEQHLGINSNSTPFVRVPILGLCKRVFVSGAGDPEYNGIYFCTGSNGNGFLFSKPRFPRLHQSELTSPVKPLLCMIAKRFSGSVSTFLLMDANILCARMVISFKTF